MCGEERKKLVESLIRKGNIRSRNVIDAMLAVPREKFVPPEILNLAYQDSPQSIGCGQTISAPHMVGIMAERLELEPGMKVLEIGAGSGYHAAVIAQMVGDGGHVYTIESNAYTILSCLSPIFQSLSPILENFNLPLIGFSFFSSNSKLIFCITWERGHPCPPLNKRSLQKMRAGMPALQKEEKFICYYLSNLV